MDVANKVAMMFSTFACCCNESMTDW